MIIPKHYENLSVLHQNTMPNRTYYIPASRRMDNLVEHREASDRIRFLNGDWKFKYYKSIYELQDRFYEIDYDVSGFDEIEVPGVWQMAGYDHHQYTNVRYPFPFDPPYVPQENPCGAYVYEFHVTKNQDAPRSYLNFEGVDSCFYLWLNGTYIGYSQVSHGTSEFDVTEYLVEGTNRIAVLVLKWCDGSYLEDQDKFRMSGIFRDVYLLHRPEEAIRDYRIEAKTGKDISTVSVTFDYFHEPVLTTVTLFDREGEAVGKKETEEEGEPVTMEVASAHLWSAENPYLYTLVLETEKETIVEYVGFREIVVRDKVVTLNGQNIKFHGVNRHDSDPVTGFTIGIDQIMKDLTLMKQHNINAIRCSHYPNAPYFTQLCDKYGFMVIDEADVEAHGPVGIYYKDQSERNKNKRWNERLADDPRWQEAIVDRVKRMVERDKNRPSVVIWSMGNESAYGCNFEEALKWTKTFDSTRLTQYESARYRNYDVIYDYSNLDLYSRMYPALEEIEEYLEKDADKPFLLVEYCHSMGNGPGDLEDYFQMVEANELMCGGFVWEWCDHAVDCGKADNGKTMYHYGGDHGEVIHDGNFCLDGLVYPDRTPHTGLLEYKNVHRPVRVVSYNPLTGRLVLHNYMDFTNLESKLEILYEVNCDGVVVESGKLKGISLRPHEEGETELKVRIPERGKTYLKLTYLTLQDVPLVPAGYDLGFDEILLENEDGRNQMALRCLEKQKEDSLELRVEHDGHMVVVKGKDFVYKMNQLTGMLEEIYFRGKQYVNRPMALNIWRAPTDNDMYIREEWERAHYHEAYSRAYDSRIISTENGVEIRSRISVLAATVQRMMDVEVCWRIEGGGRIWAEFSVRRNTEFPELPRFGIRMFLDKKLEQVCYYGMGPSECYRDKNKAASHNLYRAKVEELHEDYIRPQENGSHFDCDFVIVENSEFGLTATSERTFSFNASVYSQEELECKKHNYELEESGSTILCLDYNMNGIGSNSCGPELKEEYRFDEEEFVFKITLIPFEKGT